MKGREIEKRERQNKVKNGRERREKRDGGRGKDDQKERSENGERGRRRREVRCSLGLRSAQPGSSAAKRVAQVWPPGRPAQHPPCAHLGKGCPRGPLLCPLRTPHPSAEAPGGEKRGGARNPSLLPLLLHSATLFVHLLPTASLSPGRHLPLRVAALGSTLLSKKSGFCLARHCRPFTTHA